MANKDVKLVIRARNEASKTLDSVSQSLDRLDKAQSEVARSAKTTDTTMEALGAEVAKLGSKLDGLRQLGDVSRTLKGVRDSITGMERGVRDSAAAFANFAREAQQVANQIVGLKAQSAALTEQFNREKAATEEARKATLKGADATKEMAKAKRELDRLTAKGADASAILAATQAYERAEAVVNENRATHQRLQGELAETEKALADVNAKLRESEKQFASVSGQAQRFADATTEGKNSLATLRGEFSQLDQRAQSAARGLGAVSAEQADVERATEATTAALRENEAVLKTMQRYSTGGGGFSDPKTAAALRQQREELARTEQAWKALEDEVRRQALAMRGVQQPTEAQVRAMRETVAAARQAKAEYAQLQAGLARLQGSLQSSFSEWERNSQSIRRYARAIRDIPPAPPTPNLRPLTDGSRQALSFMQRLRGEVLSLTAAYVGLYGAINQIGGVINAYQKLEAAQNRLGVVFGQNEGQVRTELLFLERQAQRLGIEFGTLSDQYSKFAIAAQSGNFSLQATREVFLGVAEAGRVAKLSTEQMGGVFQALEQIISKGKIQSEELRHQLGDRLPGAFSIMAKALGVTTAELDKMMKDGEVLANESNLLAFAEELTRQFGSQLPAALESTTTLIGRFQNNIFQAQTQVARGGFIEGLNKALRELDKWFRSREGRDFFLSLGAALGKFATLLAEVPKYFGLIQDALQLLLALKVSQWLQGMQVSFTRVGAETTKAAFTFQTFVARANAARASLAGFNAANVAGVFTNLVTGLRNSASGFSMMQAKAVAARGALAALNGAFAAAATGARALWAAIGGLPGLLITAATYLGTELLAGWIGGVEDATQKIDEHLRIVQEVLAAYEGLSGATDDWADSLETVNLQQAERNFIDQADLYKQAVRDLQAELMQLQQGSLFGRGLTDLFSSEELRKVRAFVDQFDPRNFNADNIDEFTDSLLKLNDEITSTDAKKLVLDMLELAQNVAEAEGRMDEAAAIAAAMGSVLEELGFTAEEAEEYLQGMSEAAEESGGSLETGAEGAKSYKTALEELKGLIPGVAEEMERLKEASKLDAAAMQAFGAAIREGRPIGEALELYRQAAEELDAQTFEPFLDAVQGATGSLEKSAALLRQFEGYRATPYNDPRRDRNGNQIGPNIYRAGYGSDTVTLADGSVRKITQGMRVSVADANRDLIRRIGEFQTTVRSQIGSNRFEQFTQDQQAALTSIAYNYGSLPDRIVEAVRSGSNEQIAAAIRGLGADNGGINAKRRSAEAFFFTGRGTDLDYEVQAAQEAADARAEGQAATAATLADLDQQLAREQLITLGKDRQLAQQDAINQALKENANISGEDLARVAEQAGKIWDEENVIRVRKAEEEATAARLEEMEWQIDQQELINQGLERQAAIEQAMREAREENPNISQEELDRIAELTGRTYDLQNAETSRMTALEAAEARVNQLLEHRQSLQELLRMQMEAGDTTGAQQTQIELDGVNAKLQEAIQNAIAMWQAIGGPEADAAIAKLRQTQYEVQGVNQRMGAFGLTTQQWGGIMQNFASGLTGVFKKFASAIANGEDAMAALGEAFLEFAANFLIQIGEMIIQQALFNSLQGAGMGGGGGGFGGLIGGLFGFGHTGGLVGSRMIGSGNPARNIFADIPYFHDGGIVGLKPDETMAVLRKNEEVLTENDPRNILNGGAAAHPGAKAGPAPVNLKIVNSFDSAEVVSEGMNTPVGEQTLLNIVRKNSDTINGILGN